MAVSLGVFIFPWPCVWPPAAGSAAAAAAAAAAGSALKLASAGSAVLAGSEVPADCAAVHGTGVLLEDRPVAPRPTVDGLACTVTAAGTHGAAPNAPCSGADTACSWPGSASAAVAMHGAVGCPPMKRPQVYIAVMAGVHFLPYCP